LTLRLVQEGTLHLATALARLTVGPAAVLGLPFGRLDVGRVADVCVFDPTVTWELRPETLVSHGRNSPFLGWEFQGRVAYTLLGGQLVYSRPDLAP
jgi:dihydroorotase